MIRQRSLRSELLFDFHQAEVALSLNPARRSFVGEGTQKAADLSSRVDDGCQIGGFACRHNSEEICAAGESHPALSQGATD